MPFGFKSVRCGEIPLLIEWPFEKSSCRFGALCNGDGEGLPLLTFLDGEERRPTDLRGVPFIRLLRGDTDRGMLRRAFLALRTTSSGSTMVPVTTHQHAVS